MAPGEQCPGGFFCGPSVGLASARDGNLGENVDHVASKNLESDLSAFNLWPQGLAAHHFQWGVTMQRISKSVGKGGKNEQADVKIVQELLNKFTKIGGYSKLSEDGKVGKDTLGAIKAFQGKVVGMARPDSLVEPGKNTIKKLNENPSAVEKEAKEKSAAEGAGKGGVSGKTNGVGKDILDYLEAVAKHYGITIRVTSGKRSPDEQAEAMFDNWIKLKRGDVYKSSTLSANDKKTLDGYYKTAAEEKNASSADVKKAKDEFLKLAAQKVGTKSKHATGRAVDVDTGSVSKSAYKAILLGMEEVPEGGRTDIYHFEKESKVPAVTADMKAKWPK
jgi:hypothetical protein